MDEEVVDLSQMRDIPEGMKDIACKAAFQFFRSYHLVHVEEFFQFFEDIQEYESIYYKCKEVPEEKKKLKDEKFIQLCEVGITAYFKAIDEIKALSPCKPAIIHFINALYFYIDIMHFIGYTFMPVFFHMLFERIEE